jgi:hypothetical protein
MNDSPVADDPHGSKADARKAFYAAVEQRLRHDLPPTLRTFRARGGWMQVKIDLGLDRVHYEVWPAGPQGFLEIGLHFEDGPTSTAAYLAFFDNHIVELKHDLGRDLELERWTPSWGHLFYSQPLPELNRATGDEAGARLAPLIAATWPLVLEAAVPAERRGPERPPMPRRGRRG